MSDITPKEMRNFVRERAREADRWAALDAMMGEAFDLHSAINARKAELASLDGQVAQKREAIATAESAAEEIRERVDRLYADRGAEAESVLDDAKRKLKDAERVEREARELAETIIADAKAGAARLAAMADELRVKP